jgi:hypothetical protein
MNKYHVFMMLFLIALIIYMYSIKRPVEEKFFAIPAKSNIKNVANENPKKRVRFSDDVTIKYYEA